MPKTLFTHVRQHNGFTLIETLVAVTIVAFAIAGPLYSAGASLAAANNARQQLEASNLAQQGLEYVRAIRDTQYLQTYQAEYTTSGNNISADAWNAFVTSDITGCATGAGCYLNLNLSTNGPASLPSNLGTALQQCAASGCNPLTTDTSGLLYETHPSSGPYTPYTRTIYVGKVGNNMVNATSTVSWSSHGTAHHVTLVDDFTSWQ